MPQRHGGELLELRVAGVSPQLSYTPADRDEHYLGRLQPERCPVCLAGLRSSHGAGPRYAARLGEAWWDVPDDGLVTPVGARGVMDPRDELPECAYDGTTARLEDERCAACGRTVEQAIFAASIWPEPDL